MRNHKFHIISLLVLISLIWSYITTARYPLFEKGERFFYDLRIKEKTDNKIADDIILINAGDRTFEALGKWPWPRHYHADLVNKTKNSKLLMLDIIFPDTGNPEDDLKLAESVKNAGNVILASYIGKDYNTGLPIIRDPYPLLYEACLNTGVTNVYKDIDGLIRFSIPFQKTADETAISFSYAALSHLSKTPPELIKKGNEFNLKLDAKEITLDSKGRMWLLYSDKAIPTFEYIDVITGKIPRKEFKNKVTIAGISASGMSDTHNVPDTLKARSISGSRLNADILLASLSGNTLKRFHMQYLFIVVLFLSLYGGILALLPSVTMGFTALIGSLTGYTGIVWYFSHSHRVWIDFLMPALGACIAYGIISLLSLSSIKKYLKLKSASSDLIHTAEFKEILTENYSDNLIKLWPEISKNLDLNIHEINKDRNYIKEKYQLSPNSSKNEIHRINKKSYRFIMTIPLTMNENHFTILTWNKRHDPELLKTISTFITTLSWYSSSLSKQKSRHGMLISTILAVFTALDAKDPITGGHSNRVAEYTRKVLNHLDVNEKEREDIYLGSIIHDLGKIGIPDKILTKSNKLTDDEFDSIQKHPEIGSKILTTIDLPADTLNVIIQHHEKFDGTGYPEGLSGKKISLGARIVSVADVFDALLSDRPYRKGMDRKDVLDYLKEEKNRSFDPKIVDIFLKVIET